MSAILGIKLARRLLASVVLQDEEFVWGDQRYVTSRPASVERAMGGYFDTLLNQVNPAAIYYYAPVGEGATTKRLVSLLEQAARSRSIPLHRLTKAVLLERFGVGPVCSRRDLHELLRPFWPRLEEGAKVRQVVLAEATAAALAGDIAHHLSSG